MGRTLSSQDPVQALAGKDVSYTYLCSGQPQLADFFRISGRRVAPSVGHARMKAA
jgi:hypothetical protein